MKKLIDIGRAGGNTFAVKVYDGSDNGKRIYDTLALVGHRIEPGQGTNTEAAAAGNPELAKLPRWPMTISYFTPGTGDRTPVYTISFELYENGVSRALKLDYGDLPSRASSRASSFCRIPTASAKPRRPAPARGAGPTTRP